MPANRASVLLTTSPWRSGKLKRSGLGRVLDAGVIRQDRWARRMRRRRRRVLARGHELGLAVLLEHDRAVRGRRHFEQQRARAGEVAQHETAVAIRARERARVAIHAKDRRRHLRAFLLRDEPPRRLALRALRLDDPRAVNRWRLDRRWRRSDVRARRGTATARRERADTRPSAGCPQRDVELARVLIERQHVSVSPSTVPARDVMRRSPLKNDPFNAVPSTAISN